MYVRSNLGLMMPLISMAATPAIMAADPNNWAAPPTGTHTSWQSQLPGAKIASGYIISQSSNGQVAISKGGRNVTPLMAVSSMANNILRDGSNKIVFACCNIATGAPGSSAATSAPSSVTTSAPVSTGPSAGEVLTGVGSILSALAAPAAGIFQTYTESKMAKAALKREQQQQVPMYGPMQPQVIQQGPSTGLILGLVGGFAAIALILVLVLKK